MVDFNTSFARLINSEGGYTWHEKDPGGETKFGISKRSYPDVDIKGLDLARAKAIYYADFWLAGQMDKIDPALSFQVFDAAVNHGIGNANRMLQKAAGVADDGHVGPMTLAAVNAKSVTDLLMLFIAVRIRFWTKLSTWDTFGRGWANRAADDLVYAAQDS